MDNNEVGGDDRISHNLKFAMQIENSRMRKYNPN